MEVAQSKHDAPKHQQTPQNEQQSITELQAETKILQQPLDKVDAVFDNPLLLDKIIKYAVHRWKGKIFDRAAIASTRLASRRWLQSTSRIIKTSTEPVIKICLEDMFVTNKVNGKEKREGSKLLLNKFVSTFQISKSHLDDSVLPIQLLLGSEFFRKENFTCLKNLFQRCSHSLLELDIDVPKCGGSMPLIFGALNLPVLRKFYVSWDLESLPKLKKAAKSFGSNENFLPFLQSVFDGASNLELFEYCYIEHCSVFGLMKIWDTLRLPQSLLTFQCKGSVLLCDHSLLMNQTLPNLKHLHLDLFEATEHEQFYEILNRFSSTITTVSIHRDLASRYKEEISLSFPLMEKLEFLQISGYNMQLDPSMRPTLSNCMSHLKKFRLVGLPEASYLEWVKDLKFTSVEELDIEMSDEHFPQISTRRYKAPSRNCLQKLIQTFPNVHKLNLTLYFEDTSILKELFEDWTTITKLHLIFVGTTDAGNDDFSFYSMASILLGLPRENIKEVHRMMESPSKISRFGEQGKLKELGNSIFNLTDLTTLTIEVREMDRKLFVFITRLVRLLRFAITKLPIRMKSTFLKNIYVEHCNPICEEGVDLSNDGLE